MQHSDMHITWPEHKMSAGAFVCADACFGFRSASTLCSSSQGQRFKSEIYMFLRLFALEISYFGLICSLSKRDSRFHIARFLHVRNACQDGASRRTYGLRLLSFSTSP